MNDWEILDTVGTEQEALLIAGFLESREVPVRVESRAFRQEPVTFGALSGVRVRVPPEYLAEARRLLETRRHRFAIVDGEGKNDDGEEALGEVAEGGAELEGESS
jgi:hypothetical protein